MQCRIRYPSGVSVRNRSGTWFVAFLSLYLSLDTKESAQENNHWKSNTAVSVKKQDK